jgi:hypothetical protein
MGPTLPDTLPPGAGVDDVTGTPAAVPSRISDRLPGAGVRVEGPILPAQAPRGVLYPPTPPSSLGPFQPGAGMDVTAGNGPEPPPSEPLLVVPPAPPPLPALPPGMNPTPDSAYGTSRSTIVNGPVGVLGNTDGTFLRWYKDTFLWGDTPFEYRTLPYDLLWQIPLANQREPRFYAKFNNYRNKSYIDTAIGGQFGIGRIAPKDREHEGIQLDAFAVVFSRFDPKRYFTSADFRAGIPLTYAKGPWSTKLSYEHTSTHLGDEYLQAYNQRQVPLVLDEMVYGLARMFGEHVRLYGQVGYAFNTAKETNANQRSRFDLGIQYSNYADTGPVGRPYVAFDMDLRQYQGYRPNDTFQAGWQWVNKGHSIRLGVEIYNGKSPYGQFYKLDEHWVAFAGYYDW